jgi:hypothetical protein
LYFDTNLKIIDNAYSLNAASLNGRISSVNPHANQIPVLDGNANLVLPYTNAIVTNTHAIRRINGNALASDYLLRPGEEVYYVWESNAKHFLPLRIATEEGLYLIIINSSIQKNDSDTSYTGLYLYPNNQLYNKQIRILNSFFKSETNSYTTLDLGFGKERYMFHAFWVERTRGMSIAYISTYTDAKIMYAWTVSYLDHIIKNDISQVWGDITISWTSLGTLYHYYYEGMKHVYVKRLV